MGNNDKQWCVIAFCDQSGNILRAAPTILGTYVASIECFHSRGQHLCKFIETKESVCIRKEFNSQRIGLGHQHGRRFIVLGHQYGRRDVMWKHSICLDSHWLRMNGMHRKQSDHVHLDLLSRETYVKAQRWSKNILTFYCSRPHFLTFANTCNNIVTKALGFLSKSWVSRKRYSILLGTKTIRSLLAILEPWLLQTILW